MAEETPTTAPEPRPRWSRGRRGALTGLLALLLALVVLGVAAALGGRTALYATGLLVDGGSPAVDPGATGPAGPEPTPTPPGPPPSVLGAPEEGEPVSEQRLARRVDEPERGEVGGRFDLRVDDALTGEVLLAEGTDRASVPASVQKVLTGAAVLHALGPEHTFATTVERRGDTWVLVGGGDPLLTGPTRSGHPARGSLEQLADQTVAAAEVAGVTSIDLAADSDLFAGPDWNPDWPESYRNQVTPVSALVHEQGRTEGVTPGPRESDPAREALTAFAGLLEGAGLAVDVSTEAPVPDGGEEVAEVRSPTVAVLVERMLQSSDNDIAETLFRQAALGSGEEATFTGGARAVRAVLDQLGVDATGIRTRDGSGLSRENRLAAPTVSELLGAAVRAEGDVGLAPLLGGLPTAGSTGSLTSRFTAPGTTAGRGQVRAKTGSLRATRSLAGLTRTADGRLLTFAFLVDGAENDYAAQVWLDRAAAAVSSCGC